MLPGVPMENSNGRKASRKSNGSKSWSKKVMVKKAVVGKVAGENNCRKKWSKKGLESAART